MEVPNRSSKIEKKIQKNPKDIVRSSLILSLRQREVYPQEKVSGCCFCLSGLKCNTQETQEMSKGIIPAQSVTESVQNEYRQFRPRNSTTRKQDKKTTQQQPWLLFYREERIRFKNFTVYPGKIKKNKIISQETTQQFLIGKIFSHLSLFAGVFYSF